jgi:hypothetical protein
MSNFYTTYELNGQDLHISLALPFFFENCELEIDYSLDKSYKGQDERCPEQEIEYKSINVLSILTEKGNFIPTDKQTDIILCYLKDSILDEEVEINEIRLHAKHEQEKVEWLCETKFDWRD